MPTHEIFRQLLYLILKKKYKSLGEMGFKKFIRTNLKSSKNTYMYNYKLFINKI